MKKSSYKRVMYRYVLNALCRWNGDDFTYIMYFTDSTFQDRFVAETGSVVGTDASHLLPSWESCFAWLHSLPGAAHIQYLMQVRVWGAWHKNTIKGNVCFRDSFWVDWGFVTSDKVWLLLPNLFSPSLSQVISWKHLAS